MKRLHAKKSVLEAWHSVPDTQQQKKLAWRSVSWAVYDIGGRARIAECVRKKWATWSAVHTAQRLQLFCTIVIRRSWFETYLGQLYFSLRNVFIAIDFGYYDAMNTSILLCASIALFETLSSLPIKEWIQLITIFSGHNIFHDGEMGHNIFHDTG